MTDTLRLWLSVLAALALMLAVTTVGHFGVQTLLSDVRWVAHTYQVLSTSREMEAHLNRAESAVRSYMLSHDKIRRDRMESSIGGALAAYGALQDLTTDNKEQQDLLSRLKPLLDRRIEIHHRTADLSDQNHLDDAQKLSLDRGDVLTGEIRNLLNRFVDHETQLLTARTTRSDQAARSLVLTLWLICSVGILSLILAGMMTQNEVTSREDAEANLRSQKEYVAMITRACPEPFVAIDSGSRIMAWNSAAERMFGWAFGEVKGLSLADCIIPAEQVQRHTEGVLRYLQTGISEFIHKPMRVQAHRKDGRLIDIVMRVMPVHHFRGVFFFAFVHAADDDQSDLAPPSEPAGG